MVRALPGVLLGAAGMLAVATGVPLVGLLTAVALVVLTPWSRSLAVRAMIGLLAGLATAAVALEVPSLRWGTAAVVLVLAGQTVLQVTVALVHGSVPLRPRLPAADAVALTGGGLVAAMLGAPYVGRSSEDVLLDLARGFDPVNHVLAVANLVMAQGSQWSQPSWSSPDGSPLVMADYPLGFHALVAAVLGLAGVEPSRDLVVAYAWTTVLVLGACAALLGWIAVRVARPLGPDRTASARTLWAAVGYAACVLVGGAFVGPFELGHAPFLVAATAGIVASWLALELLVRATDPRGRVARTPRSAVVGDAGWPAVAALGVLVLGLVGLVGAYPPLAAGLAPATVVWVWQTTRTWSRPGLRLGAVVALVLAWLTATGLWRGRFEHLVTAVGQNSTPLLICVILVVLTSGAAWIAWERGFGLAPARALAAAGGYLAVAVLLAVAARTRGLSAADSYYGAKLAEAAWLAALPELVAIVAGFTVRSAALRAWPLRTVVSATGMLALAVLVGALPAGQADGVLVGPSSLDQRLLEARRAEGQVRIQEAAWRAGPSNGDASVLIDPAGWFFPVAHENAPDPQWRREAVTASLWLATLRGLRTQDTDEVAACLRSRGDVSSLACVARWLTDEPGRRVTVVVTAGPEVSAVQTWARPLADRVRIVALPA